MKFRAVSLNRLDHHIVMDICKWRNQDFVREKMVNQHIISEDEHIRFIEKMKKDDNRNLFVFYLDDEPFEVFQYEIFPERNAATCGNYLISRDYQQMGYGAIGDYFIGEIIFDYLKIKKLEFEVLGCNEKLLARSKKNARFAGEEIIDTDNNGKKSELFHFVSFADERKRNPKLESAVWTFVDKEPMENMLII